MRQSPPVWQGDHRLVANRLTLSFQDLLEVRFVDAFLKRGVQWGVIRAAHEHAAKMFNEQHPFSTNRFQTDGRAIFFDLRESEGGGAALVELSSNQKVFREFLAPFFRDLEFRGADEAEAWWPLGLNRLIVLDPQRSFGQPIVAEHGVPAKALAAATRNSSIAQVARWYEVTENEVQDAIEFEQRLAA